MKYPLTVLLVLLMAPGLAHAQAPLKMDIKGIAIGVPTTDLPQDCRGSAEDGYTCSVDGQFNRMVVATTRNLQPNVVSSVGYRFNYTGEMPKLVQSISESYAVKLKASGKKYGRPMYHWERSDGVRIDLEVESNTCYLTIAKKALNDADLRAGKEKKGQIAPPKF